jgi:hypothetical protein
MKKMDLFNRMLKKIGKRKKQNKDIPVGLLKYVDINNAAKIIPLLEESGVLVDKENSVQVSKSDYFGYPGYVEYNATNNATSSFRTSDFSTGRAVFSNYMDMLNVPVNPNGTISFSFLDGESSPTIKERLAEIELIDQPKRKFYFKEEKDEDIQSP